MGIEPEAQEDRRTQRIFLGLIWESVLRDDLIFRSQLGGTYIPEHIYPSALPRPSPSGATRSPRSSRRFPGSSGWRTTTTTRRTDVYGLQFINQLEWLVGRKLLGEHNLQIKNRFYTEQEVRKHRARATGSTS